MTQLPDPKITAVYRPGPPVGSRVGGTVNIMGFAGALSLGLPLAVATDLRRALAIALEVETIGDKRRAENASVTVTTFRPFNSVIITPAFAWESTDDYRLELPRPRAHELLDALIAACKVPRAARTMARPMRRAELTSLRNMIAEHASDLADPTPAEDLSDFADEDHGFLETYETGAAAPNPEVND